MDRSNKHSSRVDDQMRREVAGHLQGSGAGSRVDEWHEPEPPADGEPGAAAVPTPDPYNRSDAELQYAPDEIEDRSRLGRYLPRSVFPAGRAELLVAARDTGAPDEVLAELDRLPDQETFETVARVWAALGHDLDQRF